MAERLLSVRLRAIVDGYEAAMGRAVLATDKVTSAGQKMEATGKKLSVGFTAPMVAAGTFALKSAINFESAFTGVRKTVDATDEQLATLRKGITDMANELPSSREEIAGIAEMAGQLGINVGNIEDFTHVILDLGVATNLAGEEGASMLARFANITGMRQTEFRNMASSIVELGNNSATTEAEIASMSLRIAGAGTTVGLSEAQILGLSAALSSVGVYAEMGGSAFSSTLLRMQSAIQAGGETLDNFARIAGMSSDEFAKLFQSDSAEALTRFVEGVNSATNAGEGLTAVLGSVGIKEIRARDAISRLAGANDLLRRSLGMSVDSWDANVAATREAEMRYRTTASKLSVAWNQITDAARKGGEAMIPAVQMAAGLAGNLADSFGGVINLFTRMPTVMQATAGGLVAVGVAAGPTMFAVGKLTQLYRPFVDLLVLGGRYGGMAAAGIIKWGQAAYASAGALRAATVTGQGFTSALVGVGAAVGPQLLLAAAVVGVATALYVAKKRSDEFNASHRTAAESSDTLARSLNIATNELRAFNKEGENTKAVSNQEFALDNSDAIETIRALQDETAKQDYIIQIGYRMRLQGASPEETFEAIQRLAEVAGVELPVDLKVGDLDDFQRQVDGAIRAVKKVAEVDVVVGNDTKLMPSMSRANWLFGSNGTLTVDKEAEATLKNVGQMAADAFKVGNVQGFVAILGESEKALKGNSEAANILADSFLKESEANNVSTHKAANFIGVMEELTRGTNVDAVTQERIRGWLKETESLDGAARVTKILDLASKDAAFSMDEHNKEAKKVAGTTGELSDETDDAATAADNFKDAIDAAAGAIALANLDFDAGTAAAKAFGDALERSTMVDDRMSAGLGLGASLKSLREGLTGASDSADSAEKAVERLSNAARSADPKMAGLETRLGALSAAGDAFTRSIASSSMLDDQAKSAINLGDAFVNFRKTFRRLPAELDMVAVATGKLRPRTVEAINNMISLGNAATDYLATLIEMGESEGQVQGEAARMRGEYEAMFRQMGLNESQIRKYIETMGLTPEQITTAIKVSGIEGARFTLQAYVDLLGDKIPDEVATKVIAQIDAGDIEGANKSLSNFATTVGRAGSAVKDAKKDLWELPKTFDPLKAALGEYTDAQQSALDAVMRFGDGVSEYLSTIAHDGNMDEVRDQAYKIRDAFLAQIGMSDQVGKSYENMSGAAKAYLDLVGLSDWQIESAITLSGDAEAMFRIQMYAQFLGEEIPPEVVTEVLTLMDEGKLQEASDRLARWREDRSKDAIEVQVRPKLPDGLTGIPMIDMVLDPTGVKRRAAEGQVAARAQEDKWNAWTKLAGRRAVGGRVYGIGTTTSDSNPYMLSRDEYVLKASAAQRIGYDNLDAMNRTGELPVGVNIPTTDNGALLARLGNLEAAIRAGGRSVNFGDINVVSPVESQTPARIVAGIGRSTFAKGIG